MKADLGTLQRVARSVHQNASRIAAEVAADRARPATLGDVADLLAHAVVPRHDLIGLRTCVTHLRWLANQLGDDAPLGPLLRPGSIAPATIADWLDGLRELETQILRLDDLEPRRASGPKRMTA